MNKLNKSIIITIFFIFGILVSFISRGDFAHFMLLLMLIFYVMFPCFVLSFIFYIFRNKIPKKTIKFSIVSKYMIIFSLVQIITFPIGLYLNSIDIDEAKKYCEKIYYIKNNNNLSNVELDKKVSNLDKPKLINHIHYHYKGNGFYCEIYNPASFFTILIYQGEKWRYE